MNCFPPRTHGHGETLMRTKTFAYAIGASSYNGEAIRNVILTLKDFPSALGGTVSMGPDHYAVLSHVGLWQARNGKLVSVPVP